MDDQPGGSEEKFTQLIEEWKENNEKTGYDPVPFLTDCAKIFENETVEFRKSDPDPFDERHPEYIQVGCTFGKLLVSLAKSQDLIGKLTSNYIRSKSDSGKPSNVAVATARFLLASLPGLELQNVFKEKEWLTELLFSWITDADEPLRTYATGLLVGAVEPQKTLNEEYIKVISILLKRLWNYMRPGKFPISENPEGVGVNHRNTVAQKRKLSAGTDIPTPKKINFRSSNEKLNSDEYLSIDFYDNDLSNSSWSEQMPALVGNDYSLEPPLSPSVRQRFILDFLKGLGEYQDLLSVFLELKALDLINIYLQEKKSDAILTFKALEFLASLLCHNKVATEFIELNGIPNLLSVNRPSMGSTGVSLCLYYLAYKKEAMERACQLPPKVLNEMVKYAIWLLECSHETGRSHAALFFSISFSFRVILQLFDKMNGLRCLMNMISTSKPITNSQDENYDPDEDPNRHFIRQTTRTVCVALKKYFEAHLQIKISSLQKSFRKSKKWYTAIETVSKYKPMVCSREQFFEHLETFTEMIKEEPSNISSTNSWLPILTFLRLDGVTLMLKIIDIALDWSGYNGQTEVIRSALDVLAVITLTHTPQMLLSQHHGLNNRFSGISIILVIAKGGMVYFTPEGDTQKSALAVIVNCVNDCINKKNNSPKLTATTPRSKSSLKSLKKDKETLRKCVQHNNGIHILLNLLVVNQPALHADQLRYLACKALLGLSSYEPVAQIMSKLPFFINGQIQSITREPVLSDKKRLHAKFCRHMELLFEKVSGRPMNLEMDLDAILKSHIVSETNMQYDNKEVLQMIHNHLVWSKLYNAAETLARDAGLSSETQGKTTPRTKTAVITSSNIDRRTDMGGGDAASTGRVNRRISFTRGAHAIAESPTPSQVINITTPSANRRVSKLKIDLMSAYAKSNGQQRFKLSHSGVISVKPKSIITNPSKEPPSPPTLNSIIEENFKYQHARCRNPVVTVPEFSLFSPHCCPEPRYRVEAPFNFTKRNSYRQGICPRWGGVGGESCDRQLVYSRYKPGYVFKGTEGRKVPFCSVAFMPSNEQILLGDYQGDIVVHSLYSDDDQIVQGVAGMPITSLQPSRNGELVLVTAESVWSNNCSLHTMGEQLEHKFTYEDIDYAEFAKLNQDKIIGTKEHKATVYDISTGNVLDAFEHEDMTSYYKMNRATFSPDDKLVLSDGLLWDVRRPHNMPIHKFDQFNPNISGVFHPSGLEVIINTEIWDLRNYHLLRTVSALDQCSPIFNSTGTVIYAVRTKNTSSEEEDNNVNKSLMSAFRTFDAFDYKQLAFIAVRHQIYDLAVDSMDCNVAVVETLAWEEEWREPAMSVCRFYEVGMEKGDEEDDEESNFDGRSSDGDSTSSRSNDGDNNNDDAYMDTLDDMFAGDDDSLSGPDSSDLDSSIEEEEGFNSSSEWESSDEIWD